MNTYKINVNNMTKTYPAKKVSKIEHRKYKIGIAMVTDHWSALLVGKCGSNSNIAFARGGAHLPIAHALRLLSTNEIEIEKK